MTTRLYCSRCTKDTFLDTNLVSCCLYFVFNPESCIRGTTHVPPRRCKLIAWRSLGAAISDS